MNEELVEWPGPTVVPPVPADLEIEVHRRVNRLLLLGQIIDLAVRGLPMAVLGLARAVVGFGCLTVFGRFELPRSLRGVRDASDPLRQ
jgi:hypothetical protein